jgi:hypothetical protein
VPLKRSLQSAIGAWLIITLLASPAHSQVAVRWDELRNMVADARVEVFTSTGTIKGRVRATDDQSMTVGREIVHRNDVSRVKITRYVGNGRKIGRGIGFVTGMVFGLIALVAIGMDETSTDSKSTKQAKAVSAWLGTWAGATIGGWLLGRLADREVTEVRVLAK